MLTMMVPALNEERNIENTLTNIVMAARSAGLKEYEVIVVNDGSTDRTGEIVSNLQLKWPFIRMITHATPHGIGKSYWEAVYLAKYPKFTCFAGDNNAHWSMMDALFRNINKADVVTSYFINTEVRKRARNLLSTLFSTFYVTTFDLNVKYINGNTIHSVESLKKLRTNSTRYSFSAEINARVLRTNITFYEVAGWSNPDTNANQSKALRFMTLWDVVRCYILLVIEIYITKKDQYAFRAKRVGLPELAEKENQPENRKSHPPMEPELNHC